jgi:hypothetical protein
MLRGRLLNTETEAHLCHDILRTHIRCENVKSARDPAGRIQSHTVAFYRRFDYVGYDDPWSKSS